MRSFGIYLGLFKDKKTSFYFYFIWEAWSKNKVPAILSSGLISSRHLQFSCMSIGGIWSSSSIPAGHLRRWEPELWVDLRPGHFNLLLYVPVSGSSFVPLWSRIKKSLLMFSFSHVSVLWQVCFYVIWCKLHHFLLVAPARNEICCQVNTSCFCGQIISPAVTGFCQEFSVYFFFAQRCCSWESQKTKKRIHFDYRLIDSSISNVKD